MMHTIMPMDVIFSQQDINPGFQELSHAGVNLLVQQMPNGQKRIERILSSNPMDYLKQNLQPGILI